MSFSKVPWTDQVTVENIEDEHSGQINGIRLKKKKVEFTVMSHGMVFVDVDSRDNIGSYLDKSAPLTRSLLAYFRKDLSVPTKSNFTSITQDWVKGQPPSPAPVERPGILDWFPGIELLPQKIGKIGHYGSGKIKNTVEDWIGSEFDFVHFIPLDPEIGDGLVILWEGRQRPEVYTGDVDGFVLANEESFDSWESYQAYNDLFENGILWAMDDFGLFEGNKLPEWVVELVDHDPDLLWPDLVERLYPKRDLLPTGLANALIAWVNRRKKEAEEDLGQLRFWNYQGK